MAEPCQIYDDRRPIKSIWFDQDRHILVGQGRPEVEAIVAYPEKGQADFTPWLAIYRGGQITDRIPAWKVRIRYA